jgi:hypothetical protein
MFVVLQEFICLNGNIWVFDGKKRALVMEIAFSEHSHSNQVKNVIIMFKKTAVGYEHENWNQFCELINQEHTLNSLPIQLSC